VINFPVLRSLDVDSFGLFPGLPEKPGLHVTFEDGLTLILGANGLGKSTLIQILYRLLTGPFEIPGLDGLENLGNLNTRPTLLVGSKKATFANRDSQGARSAIATVSFSLGERQLSIKRRLSDLALVAFAVDEASQSDSEEQYQAKILELMGLGSFGDFILLLRHLMFYFEERRSLIWDPTAQRQLLRLLFLAPGAAGDWISQERSILELDSHMRNLRNAVGKEEQIASRDATFLESASGIRAELDTLEMMQHRDEDRREPLDAQLAALDEHRQQLRLEHLKLEQQHDSRQREYERAKLAVIRSRFPSSNDSTAFLMSRLLSDSQCLVCGHHAPVSSVEEYANRVANESCLICGTDLHSAEVQPLGVEFAGRALDLITSEILRLEQEQVASHASLTEADALFSSTATEMGKLDSEIEQRGSRINFLRHQLPRDENDRREQLDELARLRRRVTEMKEELASKQGRFSAFVEIENRRINQYSTRIKESFLSYAQGFLVEECSLTWAPFSSRVGQTGEPVAFPAFGLEMTGSDFVTATRRSSPDQVSESQREFIDLAFRMSLMEVASDGGNAASLLIDAPESSLDAVFAGRAAKVLARFAHRNDQNRLIVTSNLVQGTLIPELIKSGIPAEQLDEHVINLLQIAMPTAAVRILHEEYELVYQQLLAESRA
jgi:energy-coupling factor transporter ATP-binding protein EcfA2